VQYLIQAHVFGQREIEHVIVLLARFHFDHCSFSCVCDAPVDNQIERDRIVLATH
jgi:hypothetical protein